MKYSICVISSKFPENWGIDIHSKNGIEIRRMDFNLGLHVNARLVWSKPSL
jgi:hypothetical protein